MKVKLLPIMLVLVLSLASCVRSPETAVERRIARVERGLLRDQGDPPWKRMHLLDRMAHYHVPGVSIAVINDNRIEWAKGYGVLEAGTDTPVTPDTLFQTGSIGKPVVAVAALHLVEQGLIDLDADVNRYLVSWQVPENAFTAQEKVTLRRLLSHSAGMPHHDVRGYAQGEAVPTLQQMLDGAPPANSAPIRVSYVPGTQAIYSNAGYMVVQPLLEDLTGQPFPQIVRDAVLEPCGMNDSTLESPLPEELEAIASSGHRTNGAPVRGRWHTYPEMGPGGSMWSTPSDMARFLIAVMDAYAGRSSSVLSPEMAREMLTPQIENRGLGPTVYDEGGDRFYFMHDGATDGYETYLAAYPKRGQGVVIMTNADSGDALWDEIVNSVTVEYGLVPDYTALYVGITAAVLIAVPVFLLLRRKRTRDRSGVRSHERLDQVRLDD
jgi:CubicO group peptidase (beta-lactamase class C family)